MTRQPSLTPFRIQKFLAGLRYPAIKPEMLERARVLGADDQVMRALVGLPDRSYDSPIAVSRAVDLHGM
jgi:hypothetical protein